MGGSGGRGGGGGGGGGADLGFRVVGIWGIRMWFNRGSTRVWQGLHAKYPLMLGCGIEGLGSLQGSRVL